MKTVRVNVQKQMVSIQMSNSTLRRASCFLVKSTFVAVTNGLHSLPVLRRISQSAKLNKQLEFLFLAV